MRLEHVGRVVLPDEASWILREEHELVVAVTEKAMSRSCSVLAHSTHVLESLADHRL